MLKRWLAFLGLAAFLGTMAIPSWGAIERDKVWVFQDFGVGKRPAFNIFKVDVFDATVASTLTPGSSTRYPWSLTINPTRAAGASGLYLNVTQTTNALSSGSLQALDVVANAGSNTNTGTIRGAQIKARQPDAGTGGLTAAYLSVDIKDQATTNARGLEVSIDGEAGGTATTTQGVVVYNNSSGSQGNSYALDVNGGTASGHAAFTRDIRLQNGEYIDNLTDGTVNIGGEITSTGTALGIASGGILSQSRTLSSQTTEGYEQSVAFTTDSTFLTGSNITYSSARGSSMLKLAGTYSGVDGGFEGIDNKITNSGAHTADGAGVIGVKTIVTNTAALADGNIYGGQFWSKHNHASNVMTASAALIGLEGIAYNAGNGPARTAIGGNFGYHNEGTTAKGAGSVFRGVQIVLDDAAGAATPVENTGLCIWNMAGTQTNGIKFVKSDSGFTSDIELQNGEQINNTTNGQIGLVGTLTAPQVTTVTDATDARVCTSADYGKIIILTHADTVAVTLPANGATAGSWIDFMLAGNDSLAVTISAATTDTLIGPNDVDLKSVTWGSGHRIGAYAKFISDGTYWHVYAIGGTTITYTD